MAQAVRSAIASCASAKGIEGAETGAVARGGAGSRAEEDLATTSRPREQKLPAGAVRNRVVHELAAIRNGKSDVGRDVAHDRAPGADIRTRNEPGPDTAGKEVAASEVNDLLALESDGSPGFELDVVLRILLVRLSAQDRREVGV